MEIQKQAIREKDNTITQKNQQIKEASTERDKFKQQYRELDIENTRLQIDKNKLLQDTKDMREKNQASMDMLNQNELRMSEQSKKISALEEQLSKQKE